MGGKTSSPCIIGPFLESPLFQVEELSSLRNLALQNGLATCDWSETESYLKSALGNVSPGMHKPSNARSEMRHGQALSKGRAIIIVIIVIIIIAIFGGRVSKNLPFLSRTAASATGSHSCSGSAWLKTSLIKLGEASEDAGRWRCW